MAWRKSVEPITGYDNEEEEIVVQDVGPQGWMVTYPVERRKPRRTRRYYPTMSAVVDFIRSHFGDACADELAASLPDAVLSG